VKLAVKLSFRENLIMLRILH